MEQIGVSPAEDESQAIRVCLPYGECNGGETGRVCDKSTDSFVMHL